MNVPITGRGEWGCDSEVVNRRGTLLPADGSRHHMAHQRCRLCDRPGPVKRQGTLDMAETSCMRGPDALSGAVHKPRTTLMTAIFYERFGGVYIFCLFDFFTAEAMPSHYHGSLRFPLAIDCYGFWFWTVDRRGEWAACRARGPSVLSGQLQHTPPHVCTHTWVVGGAAVCF